MVTVYNETPTVRELVQASPAIVRGRIQPDADVEVDRSSDRPQVQTTYRVAVEETLKGNVPGERIAVRLVGGSHEDMETPPVTELNEGDKVVLFLAPDYGPNRADGTFVPVFSGCFHEDEAESLPLPNDVLGEVGAIDTEPTGEKISVPELRDVIEKMTSQQIERAEVREPEEVREAERNTPVEMEIPDFDGAEARDSAPLDPQSEDIELR